VNTIGMSSLDLMLSIRMKSGLELLIILLKQELMMSSWLKVKKEYWIPYIEPFLVSIDSKNNKILVDWDKDF
jgi:ribosomal 30S subunit maturation factor RimM